MTDTPLADAARAQLECILDELFPVIEPYEKLSYPMRGDDPSFDARDDERFAIGIFIDAVIEAGFGHPQPWEYGSRGYCFDWDDRRCREVSSDLETARRHEEESHGGNASYLVRRRRASRWETNPTPKPEEAKTDE